MFVKLQNWAKYSDDEGCNTTRHATKALQQQIYITWHSDVKCGSAILPLCCMAANMLRCCEQKAHTAAQPDCLWVKRVGTGAYLQKREKMRDWSHSQRTVPDWCCSASSSSLSNPNEKFQITSKVALERENVFPPLLSPFLDNNFKS